MVNRQPVVAVIGAGIAGLEAARQLAALGYKPVLIEKSDTTGGHVAQWNRLFPDMTPAADVIEPLRAQTAGVKTLLGTEISAINRLKDEYNLVLSDGSSLLCQAVLFATGFRLFDASKKEEYGYGIPALTYEELAGLVLGVDPWDLGFQMHQVAIEPLLDKIGIPYDPARKYLGVDEKKIKTPGLPSTLKCC